MTPLKGLVDVVLLIVAQDYFAGGHVTGLKEKNGTISAELLVLASKNSGCRLGIHQSSAEGLSSGCKAGTARLGKRCEYHHQFPGLDQTQTAVRSFATLDLKGDL